eukprot:GFUD01026008.1.p1 GENE.GFUD01026008.1~~GFUD01026008.1.p1  ORF type:complete len:358 (+),score=71.45 GFUD01026008.1:86-1159(+)
MGFFQILKILLFLFGGATGLLVVLVSYLLQLDPEPALQLSDLDQELQNWYKRGAMVEVLDHNMFTLSEGAGSETIILIHGFPTSSFDYQQTISTLAEQYQVVVFDHLGFGFSDKPVDYTYSLVDQAEQAIQLWMELGIESAHIVSHDMGDSVLTEILSRYERGVLPDHFNTFFKSITFTNGGMKYDLINFRLTQSLLISPFAKTLNEISARNVNGNSDRMGRSQLGSIWSSTYADVARKEKDIRQIMMLNKYKGGSAITYKTISYLKDRARFESRWLRSLSNLQLPIQLMWGDDDAVSPMTIPAALAELIEQRFLTVRTIKNAGHFLALEQPQVWSENILDFVETVIKTTESPVDIR